MNKNLLIVFAFLLFNIGYGQTLKTWKGTTSSAWDTGSNWLPTGKPTATSDVIIDNTATNQPIISNVGAVCAKLTLSNSASGTPVVLTVRGSGDFSPSSIVMSSTVGQTSLNIGRGGTVNVSGNVTMGSALQNDVTFSGDGDLLIGGVMTGGTLNADGYGTVTYTGSTERAIGTYTYNNLTLAGSNVRTITSAVIVNGILSMEGATASAAPTYGDTAALRYNAATITVGPEWITPFAATGGIQIKQGTVSLSSSVDAEKRFNNEVPLVIDANASLTVSKTKLYFGGDFLNNRGTLYTDQFVYLTGNADQNIGSFESREGVAMIKTGGTATLTGELNTKELIINGLGGTLDLGEGADVPLVHTFTGNWTRTQGILNGGASLLKIKGDVVGTGGTFSSGTGTVEFNGPAQNLGTGSITYNNLVLSSTGTKIFGAKTTINQSFSIVSGVVADLTANLVHTAKTIKLGDTPQDGGSWGSRNSNAVNKNDTYFVLNNGIVNVGPTIAVNTNSIAAITATYGSPSTLLESKSFTISGLAMTEGILVTPPAAFEVSTDGITYANTVTVGAAGNFVDKTVYVRLKGTINAGIEAYLGNVVLTSVGTTTINVAISPSTVNKAVLKVIPDNISRIYGDGNPLFTVTYDGFKNSDDKAAVTTAPTMTTTAAETSSVGKYEITASGAQSSNYTFDYTKKGEITITKAVLTITANSISRERGLANPDLTITYSGFKNNEDKSVLTKQPTITTTADEYSPVGNYDIVVSDAEALNYTFIYVKGNLLVKESSNDNLIGLAISEGTLSPAFNPEELKYTTTVENNVTTITVTPTASDSEAKIWVNDLEVASGTPSEIDLQVGENVIKTIVIAEDGTESTYEVTVTREPSHEARLSDLVINGVDLPSPGFDKSIERYEVNVPNETTSIVVAPTPMEPNATVKMFVDGVEVTDLTAPIDLNIGDNIITYVVTAQDGTTTKEYTVVVNRAEPLSNDGRLTDLVISDGELGFSPEILDYNVTVKNEVKDITLTPITSDPAATVTIGGKVIPSGTPTDKLPLVVGANEIITTVTAQDGTVTTYTVVVTREPSNNAGLADIAISEGALNPVFNTDTKDYRVDVPNETSTFIITPTPIDSTAKVEMKIDGMTITDPTAPIDLKVGDNVITVVVTAEDGTTKETYTVVVDRADALSNNSGLTDLVISEGVLSPAFAEGTLKYDTTVANDVTTIKVTPTTADTTATVTVNGKEIQSGTASGEIDLKVGQNEIVTTITAQDGTSTTYTVIVTREPSSNAGLADIVVSDGSLSPAFSTDNKDYRVDVPNETDSIVITPKTIDPTATVEMKIDGVTIDPKSPIDLKVGDNVITVVVTAEDGTKEEYTVIVNRADAAPQAIVPSNIITPNGDGKNDTWVVPGLDKYPNNSVKVFDRAARLVYSQDNYNNDWDGTFKGSPVNEDTYYYLIDLGNGTPKLKGFISILRN